MRLGMQCDLGGARARSEEGALGLTPYSHLSQAGEKPEVLAAQLSAFVTGAEGYGCGSSDELGFFSAHKANITTFATTAAIKTKAIPTTATSTTMISKPIVPLLAGFAICAASKPVNATLGTTAVVNGTLVSRRVYSKASNTHQTPFDESLSPIGLIICLPQLMAVVCCVYW